LMVIVPQEVHLVIEANLANKDIGFVHPGQKVALKVETFKLHPLWLAAWSRDPCEPRRERLGQ
jgi:hemolysin D